MEYYYVPNLNDDIVTLSQEEARHCVRVIRHVAGDAIVMVDGKGLWARGTILATTKDRCQVQVDERKIVENHRVLSLHIAVSPTKNRERVEWFVEKAVEVGIEKITFLLCDHSERLRVDMQRMERIAISAMKQSQSATIPEMDVLAFDALIQGMRNWEGDKMIAWCDADDNSVELADKDLLKNDVLLLIGPEGDFSKREIELAKSENFTEVRLGPKRLRTETAAIYGCCVINSKG
ncbi:16S rRNA (uracil(1498)-N(3))-methyltransferase [Bacteroidales bacterium OttesenSCG-928-B11]|nr:16S rRNA (uracil(1498)-N(3))-methyltransferase [Bacteroidales bacterium OttesenSCG-928-C03]MDL2311558.1 16S rRNA (uracil(1498)-N(3))-methyltransferase [Bacteroidales bacterium OttesenSCG-928-B11]MDL2325613.1 16S rRNA (uracil(1498)-N(3))-methyltransferase [Bacteroidales bacterium OttesenSCG-928-A14]